MAQQSKTRKIFDGRFEILAIVGRGSESVVYHAKDIEEGGPSVALKVLLESKNRLPNNERLRKEALAMVSSHHKYVVRLDDFHSVGGLSYLSMEFAPEGDLRRYLAKIGGRLSPPQAELFLRQTAEALDYVHKVGIVHRDIKPDNILVMNDREIRLGDFGTALLPGDDNSIEELQKGVGTMDYLAPEVLEGRACDTRSDLYSLALTFYELMCGEHPFEKIPLMEQLNVRSSDSILEISKRVPGVPEHLSAVIKKALSYDPNKRFASARELIHALTIAKISKTALEHNQKPIEQVSQNADTTSASNTTDLKTSTSTVIEQQPTQDKQFEIKQISKDVDETSEGLNNNLNDNLEDESDEIPLEDTEEDREAQAIAVVTKEKSTDSQIPEDSVDYAQTVTKQINSAIAGDREALETSRKTTSFITKDLTDRIRKEMAPEEAPPKVMTGPPVQRVPKPYTESILPKNSQKTHLPVFFYVILAFIFVLLVFGISRLITLKTDIEPNEQPTIASDLGSSIGTSVYSGKIEAIFPQPVPFIIIPLGESGRALLSIGVEGWTPKVITLPSNAQMLTVASNGFIVEIYSTGQFLKDSLNGTVKNKITREVGEWSLKPSTE